MVIFLKRTGDLSMNKLMIGILISVILFTGCASMPDVTISYYLPSAELAVTVTQTGACTEGNVPILTTDVTLTPSYRRGQRKEFNFNTLGSGPTKADVTFEFYADGRLKSVNTLQTGQVGDVFTSILELADIFPLVFDPSKVTAACKELRQLVAKGKALTIVYRGTTDFTTKNDMVDIFLTQMTVPDETLKDLLPVFGAVQAAYSVPDASVDSKPNVGSHDGPKLELIEPVAVAISVSVTRGKKIAVFRGQAWVPQHGASYALPIQKSPWFGKNSFELQLSEAGRITKLKYGGASQASGIFGALSDTAAALEGEAAKEKADRLKAEADLIFQQQRLVQCQLNPKECLK